MAAAAVIASDVLVAASVPPPPDPGHHLRDAFVARRRRAFQHICETRFLEGRVGRGTLSVFAFASILAPLARGAGCRGDGRSDGDANGATLDAQEAAPADTSQHNVACARQGDARIGGVGFDLEPADRAAGPISHVEHVEVEDGHFEVATRLEHAPGFGDDVAGARFRHGRWKAEDNHGEGGGWEGELGVADGGMFDLSMVGRGGGE